MANTSVWEIVESEILAFADRWHRPQTADRAARFMIMTGRSEFAAHIWPLASSADSQILVPTLRLAPRFRPSVLGPGLAPKIAVLPEETREQLLTLIASESGVDGMELAVDLAKADPSPKLQAEVAKYLLFRRAGRHATNLLQSAHDEAWQILAESGYAGEINDPTANARLKVELERAFAEEKTPGKRLRLLLEQPANYPNRDASIAATIADAQFSVRDRGGSALYFAFTRAPAAVREGVRRRFEAGLELPYDPESLLEGLEPTDEGYIAAVALDLSEGGSNAKVAASLAGPKTVAALIDRYVSAREQLKEQRGDAELGENLRRLERRIPSTRPGYLVAAVLAYSAADDPSKIATLAGLIASHGDEDDRKRRLQLEAETEFQLVATMRRWVEVLVSSRASTRHQLSEVARAIGRLGSPELLPSLRRLLDEDLARLRNERDAPIRVANLLGSDYGNQYRQAFARVGGDEVATVIADYLEDRLFGFDASCVLMAISNERLNLPEPSVFHRWPWFDDIAVARARRASLPRPELENTLSAPIFAAISRLATPQTDAPGQRLAIQMARIALSMPHENQDVLIERVLALPQPLASKRELLAAMAMDGFVLDANLVMQAIDEWLVGAEQDAWQKRQNTWQIEPWLELLPFTDCPAAVIDGLAKVTAFYGTGWAQRWERVLTAVGALPGPEGEALLADVARKHRDISNEYDWMRAFAKRSSASAILLYVDLCIEGALGDAEAWHRGRELAAAARNFPDLKKALRERYESAVNGAAGTLLEYYMGDCADQDDLMAMVKKYTANSRAYDHTLARAVEAVTLRHEPVPGSQNSYTIHPTSVGGIRKFLLGLCKGTPEVAALARTCLTAIDELRDEHGFAENDPRHPDVMSDLPWPPEAAG